MFRFSSESLQSAPQSVSLKCSNCKSLQEHEFVKVFPEMVDEHDFDPMELLKLTKRLTLCTKCGLIKTVN